MRRLMSCALSAGMFLFLAAGGNLWAQATAQISGTVSDSTGAVLPGVEITVTQTDTGISRTALSNETGAYILANLGLGAYRLEGVLPGFQTFVEIGNLQVNDSRVTNVVLEVGQVTQTIEVQANAALVETRSATLSSVIENQRILELPLDGRNITDLIELAGGAVNTGISSNRLSVGRTPMFAVAGSAGFATDYNLDGADHRNFQTGTAMAMPFPDATQEFKVETAGTSASEARSGSSVSAVTKSGTNEFHGNLFWFVRNDLFNARNYYSRTGSTLKRNQFGGTVGGPIAENQLFFFAGYQGTTIRADPGDERAFIPTAEMLAGDWRNFASPACNRGRQRTLRAPFVDNQIDPADFSPVATYFTNWNGNLPFPSTNDPCGEITFGDKEPIDQGTYVGRVDYQATANHSLFGRLLLSTNEVRVGDPQMWLQETGSNSSIAHSYTVGSTYLMSSTMVHSFRLSFNRNGYRASNVEPGESFTWTDAGVNVYTEPIVSKILGLNITGGFRSAGGFNDGHKYYGNSYTLDDSMSVVLGAHQLAFGLSATHGRMNTLAVFSTPHRVRFTGSKTGLGLADFMTGQPASFFTGRSNAHRSAATKIALFGADTWQAASNVTLSYGLRWEPYIVENVNANYDFDIDRFHEGTYSTVRSRAPAGWYFEGDPGFPEHGANNQWLNFSPRAGLAWDINGDGRTSVRASYALSYIFLPGDWRERYAGTGPWGGRLTLTSLEGGIADPYLGVPAGDIFPYDENDSDAPFVPRGWVYSTGYDAPSPYSQSWTLNFQRQIGTDWLASASYLGSNIMHVRGSFGINNAVYFPGVADAAGNCFAEGFTFSTRPGATCSSTRNTDQRRRFDLLRPDDAQFMSFVVEADTGATQAYHGMLLSLQRRVASGVSVNTNYTWSHCTGPYATLYGTLALWPYQTYRNDADRDKGNCESDRRHLFNMTMLAETPQFSNTALRTLASGWRFAGIYRASAGEPTTIVAGTDRALTGVRDQFVNVSGDPYGDRSGDPDTVYFSTDTLSIPATGTTGNGGRNSVTGPGTWSFDLSVSRLFDFQETQSLEFRAEAFNVTNSFRPTTGRGFNDLRNRNFGVIRNSRDPRILQFALKYVF